MIREAIVRMMFAEIRGQFSPLYDFLMEHPEHMEIVKEVWTSFQQRRERRREEELKAERVRDQYVRDEWTTTSLGEYPSGVYFDGPEEIEQQYERALSRYWRLHLALYRILTEINKISDLLELEEHIPF